MDRPALAKALARAVPGLEVIAEPEALRPFETDGLTALRQLPLIAVLPTAVDQVQAVLRYCHGEGIPVVARGAGTGLSGGALPHEAGVLLVLSKLSEILEINPTRQTARLQPGVRNLAISEAAAPYGLFYAPDPSSQIACSIGGNVAENAGGVHCLKYGLTVHNLLAVTIVTVEGDLLTLGGPTLDAPGLDLLALFTGSEGLLGVVVEVTVRLRPIPAQQEVLLVLSKLSEILEINPTR
ncbi:MAG: FAD-binding protein, partial [Pseudomonadota bacterium]|nr:FAD-binding protein [Pseudomonadota bacterium]